MSELQGRDPVDILRSRLGVRYSSGLDDGRSEIVRVLSDELGLNRSEAEATLRNLMDTGHIRYITARESDTARAVGAGRSDDLDASSDDLRVNAIPGGGGPASAVSGLSAGAAAPVVVGGNTTPPPIPVETGVPLGMEDNFDPRLGYWDFGGGGGVVPSRSRKGQVEPTGT